MLSKSNGHKNCARIVPLMSQSLDSVNGLMRTQDKGRNSPASPKFVLHSQYLEANFSIILSIFCASPGSRNPSRKRRSAETKSMLEKSI